MDHVAAMATFVRVVEAGSLSAAARALLTSLTAVSRQIAALEAHYNTALLVRTTRQIALTEPGVCSTTAPGRSSPRSGMSSSRCPHMTHSRRAGFASARRA